jgi:acyl-CoA thioesterase FadM
MIAARYRSAIGIHDASHLNFRVWFTDVDIAIMNHAALMTVLEAGRLDFMVRCGFFRIARKNKWYVPSAAISVQFMRPLKLFQKAGMITRVIHVNEQWIYLEQQVIRNDRVIAVAIVKSTVKKGREKLNLHEIVKQLGNEDWPHYSGDKLEQYEIHLKQLNEQNINNMITA